MTATQKWQTFENQASINEIVTGWNVTPTLAAGFTPNLDIHSYQFWDQCSEPIGSVVLQLRDQSVADYRKWFPKVTRRKNTVLIGFENLILATLLTAD